MFCLDTPEDVKFFGDFEADFGREYRLNFNECTDTSNCLTKKERE